MEIDWGGLKILSFFGFILAIIGYDIYKTRRSIAADQRAAKALTTNPVAQSEPERPASH
jgi:hypothetical protein